ELLPHDRHLGTETRHDTRIRLETMNVTRWHQVQAIAGKTDHFRFDRRATACEYLATVSDCRLAAGCFERESHHACQHAFDGRGRHALGALSKQLELFTPARRPRYTLRSRAHANPCSLPRDTARSSPRIVAMTVLMRVSRRASMCACSVVTRQPPRVMTGSSTTLHARSVPVAASRSRTTAASSGCKCTRTSRAAAGSNPIVSRMIAITCAGSM